MKKNFLFKGNTGHAAVKRFCAAALITLSCAAFVACSSAEEPISGPAENTQTEVEKSADSKNNQAYKQDNSFGRNTWEEPGVKAGTKKEESTAKTDTSKEKAPEKATEGKPSGKKDNAKESEEVKEPASSFVLPADLGIYKYADGYYYDNEQTDLTLEFMEDGTFAFAQESTIYSADITLTVKAPAGATVRYTLDGSMPDADSPVYSGAFNFDAVGSDFPQAYLLRAQAFLADGTASKVAARTYLVGSKLDGRFSTLIFSVSGDPEDLTEKPDGIFYGRNFNERGRESERPVYVEAWEPDGKNIISQYAGVRIYGGYSRQYSIKSMKLFARKSYDPDFGKFKFSLFNTPKLNEEDKVIKKYDKLVLRDCGNDLQFSYIRDELSQTLARLAGFECYEAVLPAVGYLNGNYYGFYWLHENYCDEYFKQKYGDGKGEFVILEGSEKKKNNDDDELAQACVDEYNSFYNDIITKDLSDDKVYAELDAFMDVDNYLDYMAWNIAICNFDWPNNNYKCFKYVPGEGEELGEGVFDGRYRFLLHDIDYTYGLYDQNDTKANFNNLRVILKEKHDRYAPLLDKLLARKESRDYFVNKIYEYVDGPLSPEVIWSVYLELSDSRMTELYHYYDYLKELSRKGDFSIWSDVSHFENYEKQIKNFADKRADYVKKFVPAVLEEKYE